MIYAILLAAGASRRMGTNKLLLPYGGESVIRHIVKTLLASGVDGIVIVTGHDPEAIHIELREYPVRYAHNCDFESGMLSSVRCGLRERSHDCDAVIVALGDHPTLDASVISRMIAEHRKGAQIVVPSHNGKRGHPLLFSMRYAEAVLTRYDDCGLRGLIREYAAEVVEIACDEDSATLDMDTPEDYVALLLKLETEAK